MRTARVVVIGGGIAGLAAGLLFARDGAAVTIVEQDPPPDAVDGDGAFDEWARRSVPQWQLPHSFAPLARALLVEHLPDALVRLQELGVHDSDVVALWLPPEQRRPDDDRFLRLTARRPVFELAIHRAVEAEPAIELRRAKVTDLCLEPASPPRVQAVVLHDGARLPADLVLDCGGRRSPVASALRHAGVEVPLDIEDCELTYFSRYFRRSAGSALADGAFVRVDTGYLVYWTFLGDGDTYGVVLAAPPWDVDLRLLRHTIAWEAAARTVGQLEPWLDPGNGRPVHDVKVMAGMRNTRRRFVVGDRPLVAGILTLGDARCTTDPVFGWGASMALLHAVHALEAHRQAPDAREAVVAFERLVAPMTDAVFKHAAAADRIRSARWRGRPIAARDTDAARRAELLRGASIGMRDDPELFRAILRRNGLLEPPDGITDDRRFVEAAERALRQERPEVLSPTREAVVKAMRSALAREARD